MPDSYEDTGSTDVYSSKMPAFANDADIKKAIQAYHYGDPVSATASAGSLESTASWTNPNVGILGKLIHLKNETELLDTNKISKSFLTAKGNLISASASSTPAILSVGTNGFVLKANSATPTGLEWYNLDTTHLSLDPSSQTIVGNVLISKASATLTVSSTSGHSVFYVNRPSGSLGAIFLQTSGVARWGIMETEAAESGANAGSNFAIKNYTDAGGTLSTALEINRATGLTTLSSLTVSGISSFQNKINAVASSTSNAGINFSQGIAPTSPVDGDFWVTTSGVYVRIDSTTYPLALVADGPGGLNANNVTSGILAGQYGGTGVNNSGKTITVSGNTSIGSNTDTVSFSTSGNTSITLPTSGTLATLGSPAFTGIPTAPTAAVDTNTTQIATTAYVVGQGYLKSATASSTYAPLASPTFTGTVTIPTLVGTDVTDSSSSTTGAFKTAGGMGIAKKLYVGSNIQTSGSVIVGSSAQISLAGSGATTVSIESNVGNGTVNLFTVNKWNTLSLGASGNGNVTFDLWCTNINLKGTVTPNAFNTLTIGSTTNAAVYYYMAESDGLLKQKSLSNVKTEIVTTAAVNSAAATTLGTVTTGVWNTGTIANQTSSYTLNIGGGAATTGQTKDINIGQNGLSGSTVNVNIGTTTSGVTSSVNIYGASIVFKPAGYITSTLNIPHGTAPDGVIQNGDVWTTTSGFFARINGTTQQFAHLASPAFSGTPTAPTAAVDTNTTQLATTAYVIGQGYLKSATASSTYAPLASPTFTGTVNISQGKKVAITTKTSAYTLTTNDYLVVGTTGTWNATLPTAVGATGQEYVVKNTGTGVITVNTTSAQTIDGSTTYDLYEKDSVTIVSDGANWIVI